MSGRPDATHGGNARSHSGHDTAHGRSAAFVQRLRSAVLGQRTRREAGSTGGATENTALPTAANRLRSAGEIDSIDSSRMNAVEHSP